MYFIPRTNRFYNSVIKLSFLTRYFLTLLLLGVVFLFWYSFFGYSYEKKILQEQLAVKILLKNHADFEKNGLTFQQAKKAVGKLHKEKNELARKCRQDGDFSDHLSNVLSLAQKFDLDINSFTPEQCKDYSWYSLLQLNCLFSGPLKNILLFLREIESSKNLIECSNFNLSISSLAKSEIKLTLDFFAVK